MAEAVGILAGDLRVVRLDQLLAHQRNQPRRYVLFLVAKRMHGALMEDAPGDGCSLENAAFGWVELVEPGGKKRLDRRRHRYLRAA